MKRYLMLILVLLLLLFSACVPERETSEAPLESTPEAESFGTESIVDYFREMTEYSASKGMKNVICVMLGTYGMSLEVVDKLCSLPHMDNIGSDPYWIDKQAQDPNLNVYQFAYEGAKEMLLVEDVENRDFLKELFEAMYEELPEPSKRK